MIGRGHVGAIVGVLALVWSAGCTHPESSDSLSGGDELEQSEGALQLALTLVKLCGGPAGLPCPAGTYCQVRDGVCGQPGAWGKCVQMPQVCDAVVEPVCGCDGQTYDNVCTMQAAGVSKAHEGPCGGACSADADCPAGWVCDRAGCGLDAPGKCVEAPELCPRVFAPQCGCDGKTYPNACLRRAAGVALAHEGVCAKCGGIMGLPCPKGMQCELPPGMCQGADLMGICLPIPEQCPKLWAPVCGCDGKTYPNDCERRLAGVQRDHDGPCADPCAPQDATGVGPMCPAIHGVAWNGTYCDYVAGCGCEGTDCDKLYPDIESCLADHLACLCPAQDAVAVGDCAMPLGVFWNGTSCEALSGCSCEGADCAHPFPSMATCETAHALCDPCAPQDATGVGPCDMLLGYRWTGPLCEPISGCTCKGADCDALYANQKACHADHLACLCTPQDATGVGDCKMLLGVYWNGSACVAVGGCTCEGADCGAAYPSVQVCEKVHLACDPCAPQQAAGVGPCAKVLGVRWTGNGCETLSGCSCEGPACPWLYDTPAACYADRKNCLCAPQDATGMGPCDMVLGVFWDGKACVTLSGCTCEGADCDLGYPSIDACEAAHAVCDPCAPQDATGVGLCEMLLGVRWDGAQCVYLSGCSCAGADCDALYPDLATCKAAHAACIDPCAPQDATGVGLCEMVLGVAWNGAQCVYLSGCSCAGTDCDALYPDVPTCAKDHLPCICAPQDAAGVGACKMLLGYRWTGDGCEALGGCECVGADCGALYPSAQACLEATKICPLVL